MSTALNLSSSKSIKLNILGKVVYTAGFALGTVSKVATASTSIIKADYSQLVSNLKSI